MSKHAVLFANLGSPDSATVPDVRRYLDEFLMDPYVIQLPWLLRRLIVSLFVLPSRPASSAAAYQSVWTDRGSPLIVFSVDLAEKVQARTGVPVAMAMRYGNPSIASQLSALARNPEVEEVLFVPLYPHYAESTVLTAVREAERCIRELGLKLRLKVLPPFYEDPAYIKALVASAQPWLDQPFDHVLFSYHGLPELHLKKADPTGQHCLKAENCCEVPSPAHATCYRHQALRTTEAFVQATGLKPGQYSIAFQSRLGRARWLEPYTEQRIRELAAAGVRKLLVLCPAFVTDCLETLEEIEIRGNEVFQEAGGSQLLLIPCLNSHPEWVDALVNWIDA